MGVVPTFNPLCVLQIIAYHNVTGKLLDRGASEDPSVPIRISSATKAMLFDKLKLI